MKKKPIIWLVILVLLAAFASLIISDGGQKKEQRQHPIEVYINSLKDKELQEIFRLVLIKNEADFLKLLTMTRFRHSGSGRVIVILGYWHITTDQKPPYDPLQLLSEQNAYTIFQLTNAKMGFSAIGLEGVPPQAEKLINTQPRQSVLTHMTSVGANVLKQQAATGNLLPQNLNADRADLQATLIWQYGGGQIRFIPLEDADFMANYKKYYDLNQQGVSLLEIDKLSGGSIIAKRDRHFAELISSLPEENIFIPVGAVHALDLCLKYKQEQPQRNIIIIFEPTAIALAKRYNPAGWQQCQAADQGPP